MRNKKQQTVNAMTVVAAMAAMTALATGAGPVAAAPAREPTPAGSDDYEPTPESLKKHTSPQWFDDAKLGFFVHWGPYSVPAWAPKQSYAEWYWKSLSEKGSSTYEHHRKTYGEDFDYDRFIEQWRPDKFNPEEWLKLFEDGGAKYFNLVSKHHDGVALWDTKTTDRSTVKMGPHRDFVKELMDAAQDSPLKKGLYFSMPEWFHPAGGWTRNGPVNPYTGKDIPYTGYKPVKDYVMDHQYPQMLELVDRFDPDIIWCDIGGNNNSNEFMARYFNQAKNRPSPKEVTVNNRCGNGISDFTTPEYAVEPEINPAKWEATRGIGHSFGYNQQEGVEDYLTSDALIDSFADIVSKNGNLLLNIGPKADGSIPEIQAERVRDLGAWLKINGEAIYGTTYWSHAEDKNSNVPVRYTVKDGALYVTALKWPGEKLTLTDDMPLADNSTIKLLGSDGTQLPFKRTDGKVDITMPAKGASATAGRDAYTFKITTPGVRQILRTDLKLPSGQGPGEPYLAKGGVPFTAKVTVTNPSGHRAPGGRVAVNVPQGWAVREQETRVDSLPAHSSKTVEVTVTAPRDVSPARYALSTSATFGRAHYSASQQLWPGVTSLDNVAKGSAATQKSTRGDAVAARAVDGNTNGKFFEGSVTHTKEAESEAWWQTDLGSSTKISDISLWNRNDCCSQRLSRYYVFVSDTPFTSGSVKDTLAQPGVKAYYREDAVGSPTQLPVDTAGRYVRVQLTSTTDPLTLAEVQVFAPPT
ncbi:alpha-L-fucosidase [Streptomyces sp. NA04227]|uniref:alpha-L-fucosidase n=1 Tax=Streptomyces sp. NA04227 TaxID=2742136 RepID=UPI001590C21B|nr:alpha-L-fucosidase [Streptomyces sp. NA04227]QKW10439.1 alpha-L-fucosidase [Streptomyces sp. NA04227]